MKIIFSQIRNFLPLFFGIATEKVPELPGKTVSLIFNADGDCKMCLMNEFAKNIFLNLFTNAIKFDRNENVTIEVGIEPLSEDSRDCWLVSVADHGPGIDDDIKSRIFDRFTHGGTSLSQGSGIGLHIAKTLVNSYKGRIWAEDRVKGDPQPGQPELVPAPVAVPSDPSSAAFPLVAAADRARLGRDPDRRHDQSAAHRTARRRCVRWAPTIEVLDASATRAARTSPTCGCATWRAAAASRCRPSARRP